MRWLVVLLTYVLSLALVASASFMGVLLLASPHAGLLPGWLEAPVLALGWAAVLVLPVVVARWVWRHHSQRSPRGH